MADAENKASSGGGVVAFLLGLGVGALGAGAIARERDLRARARELGVELDDLREGADLEQLEAELEAELAAELEANPEG